ncbi:cytochrome P450 71A6-like [Rhododendron vialii]|uniref:cytochrome P450 71A6-like n=1 Tax=Rhododendron vialii TaxID=182163 RepID=UPI00265D7775|nr:cytochrome P450 71A6-like [Rhododendron vialii]
MKSICILQLLSNKRVQSFRDVREEETVLMIEKILNSGSDVDVFIAGTDTTSTTQEWAMTELLKYPQAMKKLQAEVRRIAQPNQPIIEDDLDQMPYLKAVIKETLRLHPSASIIPPRESTKDVQKFDFALPNGVELDVSEGGGMTVHKKFPLLLVATPWSC